MNRSVKSLRFPDNNFDTSQKKTIRNDDGRQTFRYRGAYVNYPTHVRWRCARCAMCCKDTSEHERCIRVLPQEASKISLETKLKPDSFLVPFANSPPYTYLMRKHDGRCCFLEKGNCSIYDLRPITCVFFPFFLNRRSDGGFRFELTQERCRGLALGPTLPEEHFRSLFAHATLRLRSAGEDLTL